MCKVYADSRAAACHGSSSSAEKAAGPGREWSEGTWVHVQPHPAEGIVFFSTESWSTGINGWHQL